MSNALITQPVSLGAPDRAAALAILEGHPAAADCSSAPRFAADAFLGLVRDGRVPADEPFTPTPGVQRFLARLTISGLSRLDRREALGLCADQLRFMRALHSSRLPPRLAALARLLPHLPGNPTLQRVARERLRDSAPVGVLRNGVASARVLGFDPRLTLAAPPAESP
jgi:hypothetical protein